MTVAERVHVLFVIDVLYSTAGGAEGVLSRIVRILPDYGYRCSIVTFADRPDMVDSAGFGCPVYRLPIRSLWGSDAVVACWQLARIIRTERVSIVHTFFEASDLLGGIVAKLTRRILVSSRRDMGFRRSRMQQVALSLASHLFDQVHTVSEGVRRAHIAQDGLAPEKVITIPNGVDVEYVDTVPAHRPYEIGIPDGAPVIVSVGNIRAVKGIEHIVGAAAVVFRQVPKAKFLVIGEVHEKRYFERIRKVAQQVGCASNIVFAGRRTDIISILKTCNVFYLPSLSEGLSNALLEAMACSLPCVATDVGGNPEVVAQGRSGYLTQVGDARTAARHIIDLLADADRATEMGNAGRAIVESQFSLRSMIDRWVASYDDLLRRRRPAPGPLRSRMCSDTRSSGE